MHTRTPTWSDLPRFARPLCWEERCAGFPPSRFRFVLLLIGLAGYGDQTWIAQNAYDLLSYVGWENPIINPLDFYCAWRTDYQCPSCAEVQLYSFFCRTVKQGTLSAVTTTIHLIP